jgi:hypothetical protein
VKFKTLKHASFHLNPISDIFDFYLQDNLEPFFLFYFIFFIFMKQMPPRVPSVILARTHCLFALK